MISLQQKTSGFIFIMYPLSRILVIPETLQNVTKTTRGLLQGPARGIVPYLLNQKRNYRNQASRSLDFFQNGFVQAID